MTDLLPTPPRPIPLGGEPIEATVEIDGVLYQPPVIPTCNHLETIGVEPEIQKIRADPADSASALLGVRVALKCLCMGCGERLLFVPGSWELSADGSRVRAGVKIEPEGGW
jgi:hypothetical protein